MSIILINPNSTASMTRGALEAARRAVPDVTFEGWTSHDGPPVIEGPEDGRACVPPLLELVARADAQGAEAIIIACFDDTGLAEARSLASCPVIGIGQAAFHAAALICDRAVVITTVAAAVPVIEGNIRAAGLAHLIGPVRASGVGVAELDHDPAAAMPVLSEAIDRAVQAGAQGVILGCAGMVGVVDALRAKSAVPLIEGVDAAARLAAVCAAIVDYRTEIRPRDLEENADGASRPALLGKRDMGR